MGSNIFQLGGSTTRFKPFFVGTVFQQNARYFHWTTCGACFFFNGGYCMGTGHRFEVEEHFGIWSRSFGDFTILVTPSWERLATVAVKTRCVAFFSGGCRLQSNSVTTKTACFFCTPCRWTGLCVQTVWRAESRWEVGSRWDWSLADLDGLLRFVKLKSSV